MPEMHATVRWPDGSRARCYSPSLVLAEHLEEGASYALDDFVGRVRAALTEASERVRVKYGFPCRRAAAALAGIEDEARRFAASTDPRVTVEQFER